MTNIPSRLFPSRPGISIIDFSNQVRSSSEPNLSKEEVNYSLFKKILHFSFHLPLLESSYAGSY